MPLIDEAEAATVSPVIHPPVDRFSPIVQAHLLFSLNKYRTMDKSISAIT
jgi:hypothetical protein